MKTSAGKFKVLLEGDFLKLSSLAGINRNLLKNLAEEKSMDFHISTLEDIRSYERNRSDYKIEVATANDERYFFETILADNSFLDILKSKIADKNNINFRTDFHIHHRWPLLFDPLNSGYFIVMQPWEFGCLPKDWIVPFNETADDIWVYSNYLKQTYMESGIMPDNISVVHPFLDMSVFAGSNCKLELPGSKKFKFLFVGGTIYRKGIDILINAYLSTFNKNDDVCLVIKDVCAKSAYAGQAISDEIMKIAANKDLAQVIYIQDEYRTDEDMVRLYNACDCLAHPYRAEGFGLPIAEAMACGLPVIVTNFGACLDFCNDSNSFLIKSGIETKDEKTIGSMETVGYPYWANPDIEDLKMNMRNVFENRDAAQVKAANALKDIRGKFQYKNTLSEMTASFEKLKSKKIKRFSLQKSASFAASEIVSSGNIYGNNNSNNVNRPKSSSTSEIKNSSASEIKGSTASEIKNSGAREIKNSGAMELRNSAISETTGSNTGRIISGSNKAKSSTLAVCLIVKDEEANLPGCLESVREAADEIIVVDTGSKDKTILLAESYGAEVRKYSWEENFAEARNYSIKDIRSDWIFFLDADEVLEKGSIEFLKNLSFQQNPKAYYVKFLNMQSDKNETNLTEHYNLRLFNNNFGFRFTGAIHEQLQLENNAEYEKAVSPVVLRHYGYSKDNIKIGKKDKRNTAILLKAIKEEPENAFNFYNMGVNLHTEDKYREAIEYFDRTIEVLNKSGSFANYLPFCFSYKSSCYCFLGNYCRAISEAENALKIAPDFKVAYFNLANAYYFNNEFEKAIINYKNAIEIKENIMFGGSSDKSVGSWKSYNGIGLTYLKLHDYEKAREYLGKAYQLQNKSEMIIINLAVLYKLTSNIEELEVLLTGISDVSFNVSEARQLAGILLHFNKEQQAASFLTGVIAHYRQGKKETDENNLRISTLFRDIADIYFKNNDYAKAVPYFEKALQENKENDSICSGAGLCHFRLKNFSIAAQYFSRAIDCNNQDPSYFSNLGNCLSEQGFFEDAEMAYKCALLLDPGYIMAAIGIETIKICRSLSV